MVTDNVHAREFETAFCRDFHCCGLRLVDLHDLLQHYEECHVRFEEDDDDDIAENESEFYDEDGWSDSDSAPSSPSSTSASASGLGLEGTASSSASSSVSGMGAAASHLHLSFSTMLGPRTNQTLAQYPYIHSTHPLYRHPSCNSSSSDLEPSAVRNSTAHALEAFAASFGGPTKRKAGVSLADIYSEDDGNISGDNSSAFSTTILRSKNSSGPAVTDSAYPHASKRQALMESSQRSAAASMLSDMHGLQYIEKNNGGPGLFPFNTATHFGMRLQPQDPFSTNSSLGHSASATMGRNVGPIGPLSTRPMLVNGSSDSPFVNAAVDLMRQRDEVFSLMEDITRTGNANASDKPYRCTVLGCDKAYKNPNGLKYHNQHGHCSSGGMSENDSPESKPYVCTFLECGKRYKNLNGLKYHIEHSHPNLTAALRAHQSGLVNAGLFGSYPSQAAMTIAAALQAVSSSPMMMAAANAILTAQAANAANAANNAANENMTSGGGGGSIYLSGPGSECKPLPPPPTLSSLPPLPELPTSIGSGIEATRTPFSVPMDTTTFTLNSGADMANGAGSGLSCSQSQPLARVQGGIGPTGPPGLIHGRDPGAGPGQGGPPPTPFCKETADEINMVTSNIMATAAASEAQHLSMAAFAVPQEADPI
ncbi:hypothetical protein BG011_008788 [Mortierella polycephala]|uniref:C2H2-type domain-containing protein n=1 Tax=Mortierella polycephala TaxID=41804 RepID=A0A9P6TWA7_9FUNG|nr:hypothetical protein BG011_008788 [Mortierella polycephala]